MQKSRSSVRLNHLSFGTALYLGITPPGHLKNHHLPFSIMIMIIQHTALCTLWALAPFYPGLISRSHVRLHISFSIQYLYASIYSYIMYIYWSSHFIMHIPFLYPYVYLIFYVYLCMCIYFTLVSTFIYLCLRFIVFICGRYILHAVYCAIVFILLFAESRLYKIRISLCVCHMIIYYLNILCFSSQAIPFTATWTLEYIDHIYALSLTTTTMCITYNSKDRAWSTKSKSGVQQM